MHKPVNKPARLQAAFLLATALLLNSCSPSGEKRFQDFQLEIKSAVNPDALRQWAAPIILQHESGYTMGNQDVFPLLKNIQSDANPTAFVANRSKAEGKTMFIEWGGGFGHWGLIVGGTDLVIPDKNAFEQCQKWVPDIYF